MRERGAGVCGPWEYRVGVLEIIHHMNGEGVQFPVNM